nr:DNA helicase [Tanacetum cinerariifolium]
MFYMYQLHELFDSYGLMFRAGRLFQQYVVGVYCCIEQNQTDYYRQRQADIRKYYLSGIYDAISRGDREGYQTGSRIILLASFTGGPRYMYSHYLDALAICRVLGNPQYFITFTCNVNWPEIKRHLEQYPGLLPPDRADVVVRVFEQKLHDFCKYLSGSRLFGTITGMLYTIEFQKRGLPHCHTLLWVDNKDKIQDSKDVDRYILAELPDQRPIQKVVELFQRFNRKVHGIFRSACDALGLFGDEKEWDTALEEACFSSTTSELISLFAHILIFCDVPDPLELWKKYWPQMSDNIPRRTSNDLHIANLYINDPKLEGTILYALQAILDSHSKAVTDFGLPLLSECLLKQLRNKEMMEEKSYNREELAEEVVTLQIDKNLYLSTATGEHERRICAHSRFKLPLELIDESICGIKKHALILGGDFRQTLPVKKGASKLEIIASLIAESELWQHFKICTLKQNMRLMQPFQSEEQQNLSRVFATWFLDTGNGNIREPDDCDPQNSSWIRIPEKYCIPDDNDGISKLINFIYDNSTLQNPTAKELQQKAIVCPRNETADIINAHILRMIKGKSIIYKSSDEAITLKNDGGAVELLYPMEYLNTL